MIPLFVDCSGRSIVIFGGGDVAVRKALRFSGEADVHIISRSFSDACARLPVRFTTMDISTATDDAISALLDPAFLVVGALSNPGENNRIGELCRKKGILFNNADGEAGDVIIPAVTGGKNYIVAVTTRGHSPAVSRFIRQDIETRFPAMDAMIDLQDRLRAELKNTCPDQARRSAVLWQVLEDREIWKQLEQSPSDAWEVVRQRYLHG